MHKAAAWLCLSFCVAHGLVWPQPESFEAHGNPLPVSPSLSVAFDAEGQNSPIARAAGDRYLALFQRLRDTDSVCDKTGACLSTLQIRVQSNDETLIDTSYAYSMQISDSAATIWAATPYGVAYALESFTQLLDDSKTRLVHSNIRLSDAPKYQWRGLMLDAGRRFFPTDVVQNLLDTMAIAKLNVLHLHASDMCRFAVESKIYPNLTAALVGDRGGFYTQEDIKNLIAYAKQRGIRIVPEFDLPGHCRGYLPLEAAGLEFCTTDDSRSQLADTSTNYKILHDLLGEMSELFEDDVFNIGADETRAKGVCTVNATFDLERHMLDTIASDFGKTPEGWEEILFDAGAATNTTIVNAWARHSAAEITATGRRAVESASSHFYFTSAAPGGPTGWSKCWYDIGSNVPASQESLLLGGEMSMWTDTYCFEAQCGASSGATPVGAALFPPSRDSEFGKSVGGMIWPRGFVGAGAFWSYNATVDPSSADFVAAVGKINALAQQRGSLVCPNGCSCDQLTACGKPYIS